MAEQDTSQEKTEEATPKRLEKSREEGQIARSKELNTSAVLLAGTGGLIAFGGMISQSMERMMRFNFSFDRGLIVSDSLMIAYLSRSFYEVSQGLLPLFLLLLVAAIVGPIGLGGWLLSGKAMMPKFSRLNPLEGIKRMFSARSLMELFKSMAKVAVVGTLAVLMIVYYQKQMFAISFESIDSALVHAASIIGWAALALAASTILIAIVDVPFQIWDHQKKLKMTMQEVKDEMKDSEGKPEVKGRIRQLQREMAQARMMSKVPEADVVITNPTHYSVALKYDTEGNGAPVVVAKGADFAAFKIREVAAAHDVTMFAAPPLARAIYYTTELDEEIPEGLYLAVAQVLAYVFQLKSYRPGKGRKPKAPGDFDIPDGMRYDE
jgi:flagellar biosynthetic protein FlhB